VELFDTIANRRSVRVYESRPVEDEILNRIFEAINAAPSAGNLQAYDVVVVRDETRKQALMAAAWDQVCIGHAPVVLVFCTVPERSGERFHRRGAELFCVQDAAIAATFAQLAVTALGLGSVWIGSFDEHEARQAIGAPAYSNPVTILPIGYPAESPSPSPRKPLEELFFEERLDRHEQGDG
jgi:nitroreductase